jgi:hypothetical protein
MRKLILTTLFLVFGVWAVYDGWFKWPAEKAAWDEYVKYQELERKRQTSPSQTLFGDDLVRWQEMRDKYPNPPRERTQMDIYFQQFGLVPLCFPVTALLATTWFLSARRKYVFREDGSLSAPEGNFSADQMTGIDMSRWMSKSIAMLEIEGGPKGGGSAVKLDAWIYDGMEEIIETLNKRFHPDEYTEDSARAADDESVSDDTDIDAEDETAP